MSFRLLKLQISGHPILKSTEITFCDDVFVAPSVYTTCVIGANGTGKSHLMGAVASVFSEIYNAKHSGSTWKKHFSFTIEYKFDKDVYFVTNVLKRDWFSYENERNFIRVTKNGQKIDVSEICLPERVIASTMTVTDKFVAKTSEFYKYKGIRNERSVSTTGTRTIIRKTVESLMDCMHSKNEFQRELSMVLNYLGLEEQFNVSYGIRYKDLFLHPDMTGERLSLIFENWKEYFPGRENAPWGFANYLQIKENVERLNIAAEFLARYSSNGFKNRSIVVTYDLMREPEQFYQDSEALRTLAQLDLISFPSIDVVKKGVHFAMESSSSGEAHLLCQFIGIMSDIRHNSLVLIDEPENSSHPEWQMNYIGWLKNIFNEYSDCHFVIATHSPLILANLKASESTIVRLKRDDRNLVMDEGGIGNGCFSWTIDEILEEVMMMKSSRTFEYNQAKNDFEKALKEDDYVNAQDAYNRLIHLIHPQNVMAEVMRIQMIGLRRSCND